MATFLAKAHNEDKTKTLLFQTSTTNVIDPETQKTQSQINSEKADITYVDSNILKLQVDVSKNKEIAEGANSAIVFDTKAGMDTWLTDTTHTDTLSIGNWFLIRDMNTPDYWWDGTKAIESAHTKVDLSNYYNKQQIDILIENFVSEQEIDKKVLDAFSGKEPFYTYYTSTGFTDVKPTTPSSDSWELIGGKITYKESVFTADQAKLLSLNSNGKIWFNFMNILPNNLYKFEVYVYDNKDNTELFSYGNTFNVGQNYIAFNAELVNVLTTSKSVGEFKIKIGLAMPDKTDTTTRTVNVLIGQGRGGAIVFNKDIWSTDDVHGRFGDTYADQTTINYLLRGVKVEDYVATTKTIDLVRDCYDYVFGKLDTLTITDVDKCECGATVLFKTGTSTTVTIKGVEQVVKENSTYLITFYMNEVFINKAV